MARKGGRVHIDELTPSCSTNERLWPGLSVQSVAHPFSPFLNPWVPFLWTNCPKWLLNHGFFFLQVLVLVGLQTLLVRLFATKMPWSVSSRAVAFLAEESCIEKTAEF